MQTDTTLTAGTQSPGPAMPEALTIAVDTEFRDALTLTVQTAARLDDETLAVQVYRSRAVPGLPGTLDWRAYLPPERYGRVVVRPVLPRATDLSPTRMARDLLGLTGVGFLTRRGGSRLVRQLGGPGVEAPGNARPARGGRWTVPALDLTVVGHFLTADFCRLWGRDFLGGLLGDGVVIRTRGAIQFADKSGRYGDPVVEYCSWRGGLYRARVSTRDTALPFGPADLGSLAKTFLGRGEGVTLAEWEKRDMLRTFHARTADAYGYAAGDAATTLLVYEQMQARDRDVYRSFGFPDGAVPPLRPTLGSRVSTFLMRATRQAAGGCESLPSDRSLEALTRKGGAALLLDHPEASRYGGQTAKVHGGLLYSRSPTKFWHASPGMLRDVDMAGCYQHVLGGMAVYWGRPVVFEPGSRPVLLKDAVDLVTRHADPDGWLVRVSGDIKGPPNALIPSTDNAVTSANYRGRLRHGKRRAARERAFHLEALRDPSSVAGTGGSRLYASRVESGVVTWATWLMVQALPPAARGQYEGLTADTVVFYPRALAARDGKEFDALVDRHRRGGLPWQAEIDLAGLELVRRERIDADYVTLRFPAGRYARRVGEFRKEAQAAEGKGSGADLAWKAHANTMYGVLACAQASHAGSMREGRKGSPMTSRSTLHRAVLSSVSPPSSASPKAVLRR